MKALKRTIAAVMALVIVGGAAPVIPGGFTALKPVVASAEEGYVTFDKLTGTLTLSGYITKEQVQEYTLDLKVKKVYAEPGTVLPASCLLLFNNFQAVTEIDLSNADSSNVINMNAMFSDCEALQTIDLSGFDTRNVKNMALMFYRCRNLQTVDLSGFDTKNVTKMDFMFGDCYKLESVDISNFDITNVESFSGMFSDCVSLKTVDLCSFDTSNVKDMGCMFENCWSLGTITVSEKWTTPTDSGFMFDNCCSLVGGKGTVYDSQHIDGEYARIDGGASNPGYFTYKPFWKSLPFDETTGTLTLTGDIAKGQLDEYRNDSRVKHINTDGTAVLPADCNHFFTGFSALEDVDFSSIDSTNVTDIGAMFSDCTNLVTVDLTGFSTNRIMSMYAAFLDCSKLKTIYVNKYWNVSGTAAEGVNSVNMFYRCTSLVGGNGTTYNPNYTDNTYARADQGTSRPGYLTLVDENYLLNGTLYIKNFNTVDYSSFSEIKRIVALEGSQITSNGGTGLFNASKMPSLKTVTEIDLSKASISNSVVYLNSMFSGCSSLKTVKFPADYTASNVTQMASMFSGCSALTTVDLSGFNTTSLQYTSDMFADCSSLKNIDLSGLKTGRVTNMKNMFLGCSSLESLNLAGLDTGSVTTMDHMFSGCTNLKFLDIGGFDTRNVRDPMPRTESRTAYTPS